MTEAIIGSPLPTMCGEVRSICVNGTFNRLTVVRLFFFAVETNTPCTSTRKSRFYASLAELADAQDSKSCFLLEV